MSSLDLYDLTPAMPDVFCSYLGSQEHDSLDGEDYTFQIMLMVMLLTAGSHKGRLVQAVFGTN